MKLGTSLGLFLIAIVFSALVEVEAAKADVRTEVLRRTAIQFGVLNYDPKAVKVDTVKAALGKRLFSEKRLSFNSDMACETCHLDKLSSADGLPNAIGVGGKGAGVERVNSEGLIVPRNTLALWGRGGPGFNIFFWDGKVEKRSEKLISQFGENPPSNDPLVISVHLPIAEIREMVMDDTEVTEHLMKETVDAASELYKVVVERIVADESYRKEITEIYEVRPEDVRLVHIADSIANFIRKKFALRETRFSLFLAENGTLTTEEIQGGLVFYGKGRCATCHRGPYFSDFKFYSIPFPQLGFGKNGFGVDYGRFNVTRDPSDAYKFRTPPLINVAQTAPYSHSGATYSLDEAITVHFDPLRGRNFEKIDPLARVESYKKLLSAADEMATVPFLDDEDVLNLVAFLKTLSFDE